MRPTTLILLVICIIVALLAFGAGVGMDLHLLDRNVWWAVLRNGGVLLALTFGIIHYFNAQPKVFTFTSQSWTVVGNPPTWQEVRIVVTAREHGKGKNPSVTFMSPGEYAKDIGLTYRIAPNGDITFCHLENSFLPPWKSFKVKISV